MSVDRTSVVSIIGGTFSGNKGAAGMLLSVIRGLEERMPEKPLVRVISVYPNEDRAQAVPRNVEIVNGTPLALTVILPPAILLYRVLRALKLPHRFFLHRFKLLESIADADVLVDISGVSYIDGRGPALAYNVACNAPALILGTPLVKLSQALGPFRSFLNRRISRWLLPRLAMIFARGAVTEGFLNELKLKNIARAADVAFLLPRLAGDSERVSHTYPALSEHEVVLGVAPSQVLANYCKRHKKDLVDILATSINEIKTRLNAHIVILAHSIRSPQAVSKNNDFHVCQSLYERMQDKDRVHLVAEDHTPGELREIIRRCDVFVSCRLHAMISSLCESVPTLVVGWSHKYREIMHDFDLDGYVIDFETLASESIVQGVQDLYARRDEIRRQIDSRLPEIRLSAERNLDYLVRLMSNERPQRTAGRVVTMLHDHLFADRFQTCVMGYSLDDAVRSGAASGGLVTSLLVQQLESGTITGAIACTSEASGESIQFRTVLCRSRTDLLRCQTSLYTDFNHVKGIIDILSSEEGVFGIVALPCQWSALNKYLQKRPDLERKVGLRVGLWCGHTSDRKLLMDFLRQHTIDLGSIEKFWYRRGMWRGYSEVSLTDGTRVKVPFHIGYGLLQNLYVDCKKRCFSCLDHFAEGTDISCGDAWLRRLKHDCVKYSLGVTYTSRGVDALRELHNAGLAVVEDVSPFVVIASQKRAVIWHTFNNAGRARVGKLLGIRIPQSFPGKARWHDYIGALLVLAPYKLSQSRYRSVLFKMPRSLLYGYMLVQKFFLNF